MNAGSAVFVIRRLGWSEQVVPYGQEADELLNVGYDGRADFDAKGFQCFFCPIHLLIEVLLHERPVGDRTATRV